MKMQIMTQKHEIFFSSINEIFIRIDLQQLMKKHTNWTDQEDKFLLELYNNANCFHKWKFIAEKFVQNGLSKNQIQCRQRYVNKLNPDLKHTNLSMQELRSIFQYYNEYGPLWSIFQSLIQGRSQSFLKNKFYSSLRSLIRLIISSVQKDSKQKISICTTRLSSKLLVQIYQGKKKFKKFKGYLLQVLKKIDFQIDIEKINIIRQNQINQQLVNLIKLQISKQKPLKAKKAENKKKKVPKKLVRTIVKQNNQQKVQLQKMPTEQPGERRLQNSENAIISLQGTQMEQQPSFSIYLTTVSPMNFYVPIWQQNSIGLINYPQYNN